VATQAHQKGSRKSATSPSKMKTIQNIFFCIGGRLYWRGSVSARLAGSMSVIDGIFHQSFGVPIMGP
jgi:hypothetical protein